MDVKLLRIILEQHFNKMRVNIYESTSASVPEIAIEALSEINNISYQMPTSSKIIFYYKDTEAGGMNGQTILTNKREGTRIARDKFQTEQYLKGRNIRTTQSTIYDISQIEDAKKEIEKKQGLFVIKPYNLSSGKGVSLNIDINNIEEAWKKSVSAYNNETEGASIIMQRQLPGIEARFLVVNEKFSSAILRVPANVVGDGESTIEDLIEQKNYLRAKNPHLAKFMIKINEELEGSLKKDKLSLTSVIEKNKIIFFTDVSNIALGGDTLEISHLVSDHLKYLAKNAIEAIPDLTSGGVDIMFSSFDDKDASVLEINHAANLIMHYYPWKGTPQQPIHDYINSIHEEAIRKKLVKNRGFRFIKKLIGK